MDQCLNNLLVAAEENSLLKQAYYMIHIHWQSSTVFLCDSKNYKIFAYDKNSKFDACML